jgi:hypothetical protein
MPILKTSPLDALRPLTPVSDEVEQSLSASAMAEDGGWRMEDGDFESAKNMRPKRKH